MPKSYDVMMAEVSASWSDDAQKLSAAANAYFADLRETEIRLGETLRQRRETLGLSQRQLASATGIQQAEISKIERGQGNPTWSTLRKLSAVLRFDLRLVTH